MSSEIQLTESVMKEFQEFKKTLPGHKDNLPDSHAVSVLLARNYNYEKIKRIING